MLIRNYAPLDFEEVSILNQVCYLTPCSDEELRGKLQHPSWVASAGQVLGCIITCPELDKQWIWSLIVAPVMRRKGLASQLMDEAERFYRDQTLWLHTTPSSPAENLYLKRGYKTSQLLPEFYGPNMDAVEMYKSL